MNITLFQISSSKTELEEELKKVKNELQDISNEKHDLQVS